MSSANSALHDQGVTLRQAALIAGFSLLVLVIAAPSAEFLAYGKLVEPDDIEATVENIRGHSGLYLAGVLAYLIVFVFDLVVAWALYLLLIPVHRALSLLMAWFRVVYTAVAFFAMLKLVTVYRLLHSPDDAALFSTDQLHAQVNLLLDSFRYEWGFGLILFGIHLALLGYLVYHSSYIPRILGILMMIGGLGWVLYELSPYLLPDVDPGLLLVTTIGEVIFMLWLLIRGWRIKELQGGEYTSSTVSDRIL